MASHQEAVVWSPCHYGLVDSCFSQWVMVLLGHSLFWCSNWHRLGSWVLLTWAHHCWSTPYFWYVKMLQAHLVVTYTVSPSQPFLQSTLVPFRGDDIYRPGSWWQLVKTYVYNFLYFFRGLFITKSSVCSVLDLLVCDANFPQMFGDLGLVAHLCVSESLLISVPCSSASCFY